MSENAKTWIVTVSKETDDTVRHYLSQRDRHSNDLSEFIEEAVKWRLFDQSLLEARGGFSDLAMSEQQALIDEATDAVRADMRQAISSIDPTHRK